MMRSEYIGITGMNAEQQALTTIANDISNDQTVGFKSQQAEFEELFYQQYKSPTAPGTAYAGQNPMDVGNGVRVSTISSDFSQGNVTYTGNKTDMGIQGDGFFIVGDSNGQNPVYTRAGNFDLSRDNQLITKQGQYVLGWNMDPVTGQLNTGGALAPISLQIGKISQPIESTKMSLKGNLNITGNVNNVYTLQTPSYDRLGGRHDINFSYINMGGGKFDYIATPVDQFKQSTSITSAEFQPSGAIAASVKKGDYQLKTSSVAGGNVQVDVIDPSGATVASSGSIADASQTLTLKDPSGNPWFTVQYQPGGVGSTATFTVGDVGNVQFDTSSGAVQSINGLSGTAAANSPVITYTPTDTGQPVNITVNMTALTGLSADSGIKVDTTDGMGAATLTNFQTTDGGVIEGYYDDGTIKPIGQVALATFSNPAGLSRVGQGDFLTTPNSGLPNVGLPGTNARGQIKSQAIETSNVDLAKEFTDMLTVQKAFQANTKVIQSSDAILGNVLDLIR